MLTKKSSCILNMMPAICIILDWRRCLLEYGNRRVTKISATTAALLIEADISAARLDRKIDRQIQKGLGSRTSRYDHHVRKLRDRTRVPVVYLWRQYLTILLEARWEIQGYDYHYREESQKSCYLEVPVLIPDSVIQTAKGKKVGDLAQGYGAIENSMISKIERYHSHSKIYVKQSWLPVNRGSL